MIRALVLFVLVAVTAVAVGWFAIDPGRVVLDFRGWRIETSVGILALAALAVTAVGIAAWSLLAWVFGAPGRVRLWRGAVRRKRGLRALAAGMVAVAAGDARGARKYARRAEQAEADTPLTLLLGAQAAQLEGDERAAEKYFNAMLARKETEFLGLRGLVVQAQRAGDPARALAYAGRAAKLRPDAGWAHAAVFDLSVKAGAWAAAEDALAKALRRGGIDRARGAHHRAVLFLVQAAEAESRGFGVEARALAKRARRADGASVPAALMCAHFQMEDGHARRARRILERAYAANAHPEIARAYLEGAQGEGEALAHDRLRLATQLAARAPEAVESALIAAEAALDARLWGRAGKHLDEAEARIDAAMGNGARPARLYRLRAKLAEDESGDVRAAAGWLARAAGAAPDPRWVCAACGTAASAWAGVCPSCGGFDTLEWRTPAPLAALAPATPPERDALAGPAPAVLTGD
jgi:HemY protein